MNTLFSLTKFQLCLNLVILEIQTELVFSQRKWSIHRGFGGSRRYRFLGGPISQTCLRLAVEIATLKDVLRIRHELKERLYRKQRARTLTLSRTSAGRTLKM